MCENLTSLDLKMRNLTLLHFLSFASQSTLDTLYTLIRPKRILRDPERLSKRFRAIRAIREKKGNIVEFDPRAEALRI